MMAWDFVIRGDLERCVFTTEMKDPGSSVRVSGDSSSAALDAPIGSSEGDDEYVFTEDQRKAALELQSLYRKLGLEDLDDGFEEGLSAYDDPHFDIVARLHEVNTRFEEDETPVDSDRQRRVRFKETVVDLVVPISPVRSVFGHSEYDYADYDDDYDDDFEVEDLQDMMADVDNHTDDEKEDARGPTEEEAQHEEERPRSRPSSAADGEINEVEPSAPPLVFHYNGLLQEEAANEEEVIHIRPVHDHDQEDSDSDRSNCSSPEKMLKLGTDDDNAGPELARSASVEETPSQENEDVELLDPTKTDIEPISGEVLGVTTHENVVQEEMVLPREAIQCESVESAREKADNVVPIEAAPKDDTSSAISDQISLLPESVKPKKVAREPSASPRKTRAPSAKKAIVSPVKPSPPEVRPIATSKGGNSRSSYGLTEELRQELRRLKQLELNQKKMREQEQAQERKKRQEEAESAFKAWLDMKKATASTSRSTKSSASDGGRKDIPRSPTKKLPYESGADNSPAQQESSEEAFRAWLEQKHRQERRERLLQQLQRQHEAAGETRGKRDTSRKAYRIWLRRKNALRNQQSSSPTQKQGSHTGMGGPLLSSTFPQHLPRALQQAEMLNRTYQAYFGSSLWASLAGFKRHPAALI